MRKNLFKNILKKHVALLISTILTMLLNPVDTTAQDPVFSNTIYESGYYHPAATTLQKGVQLNLKYRNQWPKVPNLIETQYAYLFGQFRISEEKPRTYLGIGVSRMKDQEGAGNLVTTNNKFIVRLKLDLTGEAKVNGCNPGDGSSLAMALYVGGFNKEINNNGLLFSDQINFNGQINNNGIDGSEEASETDLGAGLNYYLRKDELRLSLSASGHHLQKIDEASFENSPIELQSLWVVTGKIGKNWASLNTGGIGWVGQLIVQYENQASVARASVGLLGGGFTNGKTFSLFFNYGSQFLREFDSNTDAFTLGLNVSFNIKSLNILINSSGDIPSSGIGLNNGGMSKELDLNMTWERCNINGGRESRPCF